MIHRVIKQFVGYGIAAMIVGFGAGYTVVGNLVNNPHIPTVVEMQQSTVSVRMADGICSGYVLKGTHEVVTAAHCLEKLSPTDSVQVKFGDGTIHTFKEEHVGDATGVIGPDLATLYTNDTTIVWPEGLRSCSKRPYIGEPTVAFGDPLGVPRIVSWGHIGGIDVDMSNKDTHADVWENHLIEFDGKVFPGNSGGALVDTEEGCVVGIANETWEMHGDMYGVHFFTPSDDLGVVIGDK